jgi:preprotein translocase subunit SecF
VTADIFVIQSITISSLQLASYLAIIISFAIFAIGTDYQLEQIKNHRGKQFAFALKMGYNDSIMTLVDLHLGAFIIYLCLMIMGGRMIRAISINLIVGVVVSAILTMLINRYLIKLLGDIFYGNKSKKLIKKEENN